MYQQGSEKYHEDMSQNENIPITAIAKLRFKNQYSPRNKKERLNNKDVQEDTI